MQTRTSDRLLLDCPADAVAPSSSSRPRRGYLLLRRWNLRLGSVHHQLLYVKATSNLLLVSLTVLAFRRRSRSHQGAFPVRQLGFHLHSLNERYNTKHRYLLEKGATNLRLCAWLRRRVIIESGAELGRVPGISLCFFSEPEECYYFPLHKRLSTPPNRLLSL